MSEQTSLHVGDIVHFHFDKLQEPSCTEACPVVLDGDRLELQ